MNSHALRRYLPLLGLVLLAFLFLFPLLWIVLSSFKPQTELFRVPMTLLPSQFTVQNYVQALSQGDFPRYFLNSLFVATTSTILAVLFNVMAGYALAKFIFPGRGVIFVAMLSTLMIPLQVIIVPIYLQLKALGMLNTLWGIIIPPAATPTGIFLARQYMVTLPNSMIEAARIDGAKEWYLFRRIILPLSAPIIATITIFSFMWRWNDYLWPLIVITDNKKQTVQQTLANFIGQLQINWSQLLAMTTIAILPVILVFFLFQRYFMVGISAGAVKG
ncbi:MAG: carbohydrate ABC transporter permease [Christensenellales bacterium]|jgi:alpha-1,4-digalacturonate transport system permease protein|nr:carbohydrate ABC transporter permease [Clostridiales bacterium]